MYNKNDIRVIDACLNESQAVQLLRTIANIFWKTALVITCILVIGGFFIAIACGVEDKFTEIILGVQDADGFLAFFMVFFMYILYGAAAVFSGLFIKILLEAGADLLYSSEVSAKIKLLEYNEKHKTEATNATPPSKKKVTSPNPSNDTLNNFVNNNKKELNRSNVVDRSDTSHIPYWCESCGRPGPYEGVCPNCYSGTKKYNKDYKN